MNEERDPFLEQMFAEAEQTLPAEDFVAGVSRCIAARDRRIFLGRIVIAVAIVALELILESPIQHSVAGVSGVLELSLVPIENEWVAFAMAPLNSLAGVAGMSLLALYAIYRKVFC